MQEEVSAQLQQDSSANGPGAFLITIDTEGDNLWSKPTNINTRNAEALPRFQELCEKYGLRPTYLANWEMVNSDVFVEFGKSVLERQTAEIGMHLHAWNSPPLAPLTDDDFAHQPYLIEYPDALLREKVKVMTDSLESAFGVKMLSHRAGRWGLDETYATALVEAGYRVDCSVTPHVDWRSTAGDPAGSGGPDYRRFPESAYFMDREDISRPGSSPLLQVPMTVVSRYGSAWARGLRSGVRRIPYVRRYVYRSLPAISWLRPTGRNRADLLHILTLAQAQHRDYVEFMLHSSELFASGSPTFPTSEHIEVLFEDFEELFDASRRHWVGRTLGEYYEGFAADRSGPASPDDEPGH